MLSILGFVAGLIAGILKLTGKHENFVIWLIILAVLLVCADVAWGFYGRRWGNRTGPAA